MFAERLDLLMDLTNTQASTLGRACLLNASYVSRLRSGARPLPKHPAFLKDMSAYLARQLQAEHQKAAMCGILKLSAWPEDPGQAAALIEQWLAGEVKEQPAPLLDSFAQPQTDNEADGLTLPKLKRYYYGVEGKREAVLQFLALVAQEKTPQTLLLASEEEMGWLYEDPGFAARWARSFTRVLMAGDRVRIIHNIGRDMHEMLEGVQKWLPIYATDRIEPYYYPKLRDSVFQRTLFLAPRTAALVSVSVDRRSEGMLNELITDGEALHALTMEFENYSALCRPLMHIVPPARREELWPAFHALVSAPGDAICLSGMPTLVTMPEWVAEAMQARAPGSRILERWRAAADFAETLNGEAVYTELQPPPARGAQDVPLYCGALLGAPGLCYTLEEWQAHLEHAAQFAQRHRGYRLCLQPDCPDNICLFAKDGRGVILLSDGAPGVASAFTEMSMVNSIWDYLARRI